MKKLSIANNRSTKLGQLLCENDIKEPFGGSFS